MSKFGPLELLILIILLVILLLPFIYLSQLQRVIKLTKVENRFIKPSSVWLVFIPIVGVFIHYHHILEIDNTLKKEFKYRNIKIDNSQFGLSAGKVFSIANMVNFFLNIFYVIYFNISLEKLQNNNNYPFSNLSDEVAFEEIFSSQVTTILGLLILIISLIGLINWIIYWNRISILKKKLSNFQEIKEYKSNNSNNTASSYNECCPNCNNQYKEGDNFCISCGFNVQDYLQNKNKNTCTSCNNSLNLSDKFCTKCGKKVEEKIREVTQNNNCPDCNNVRLKNEAMCSKCGYPFDDNQTQLFNNNNIIAALKSCPDCNNARLNQEDTCLKCGFPFNDNQIQPSTIINPITTLTSCPECYSSRDNNEETCSKCGFPYIEHQKNKENFQNVKTSENENSAPIKTPAKNSTEYKTEFQKPTLWIAIILLILTIGIYFFLKSNDEGLGNNTNKSETAEPRNIDYIENTSEIEEKSLPSESNSKSEFQNEPMDDGYNEEVDNNYSESNGNYEYVDNNYSESNYNKEDNNDNNIYEAVNQDAEFPGGRPSDYIASHFNPDVVAELEGKIIVRFVVEKDGSISNVEIARGLSQESSEETIRVMRSMPKWKPGKNGGVPVRSRFSLPIVINNN